MIIIKINNININIDDAIKYADYENILLKHQKNGLLLSDYQVDILRKNGFNINQYGNIHNLLFDIEEYLNDEYDQELDLISSQIAEVIYYSESKK